MFKTNFYESRNINIQRSGIEFILCLLVLLIQTTNISANTQSIGKIDFTTFEPRFESDDKAKRVYKVLDNIANHSWEFGLQSEVILERHKQDLSVFSTQFQLPLGSSETEKRILKEPENLLKLIDPILKSRNRSMTTLTDGNGFSGNPASLGVAVLVASAIGDDKLTGTEDTYSQLAKYQLDHLVNNVPRTPEGAISHRENEIQLFAEFIYMAVPFIAYCGAVLKEGNEELLKLAYEQVKLYRDAMLDEKTNTWKHIVLGSNQDEKLWSTGNGYAAAGMARIYATFSNLREENLKNLTIEWRLNLGRWIAEIINGAFQFQTTETSLLPNYYDIKSFDECSGTALITASAYRLIVLAPEYEQIIPMENIEKARMAVTTICINAEIGTVAPVVNPINWNDSVPLDGSKPLTGFASPEGQAFVLLMLEAYKAYLLSQKAASIMTESSQV